MFEMLNEEKRTSEDRKLFFVKVGVFLVACAAMAGVFYFVGFLK